MPYALKVTEETVEHIIGFGSALHFNLTYLRDNLKYHTEDGVDFYVITDGTAQKDNVTFTEFVADDFFRYWRFINERTDQFSEVVPV